MREAVRIAEFRESIEQIECMLRFQAGLKAGLLQCPPRRVGAFRMCWKHPSCEYSSVLHF